MLKILILYYLSVKATHGYEIQRFIQLNMMDSWTKIQSGSIYYALGRLEADGLIEPAGGEPEKAKGRRVFRITAAGKEKLSEMVKDALCQPMFETGSDKFLLYPLLFAADRETIIAQTNAAIAGLNKQKAYIDMWRRLKIDEDRLKIEELSFDLMLRSIDSQLEWHKLLLEELDECIAKSERIRRLIEGFDFSQAQNMDAQTLFAKFRTQD